MKREVLRLLRATRLLPAADRVNLGVRRVVSSARNRREIRAHPDFVHPPDDLAFDAYGHVDKALYRESGRRWAAELAALVAVEAPAGVITLLDFGCGPARVLRHLGAALGPRGAILLGCDVNARSVAWSRAQVPGARVFVNGASPPLDLDDRSIDVVHAFSVFSHMSEASEQAWFAEFARVLKPGGVLILTTQGQAFCERLASAEETRRFAAGERITLGNYAEGRKWFLALHPEAHLRSEASRRFETVRLARADDAAAGRQDVWVARAAAARGEAT